MGSVKKSQGDGEPALGEPPSCDLGKRMWLLLPQRLAGNDLGNKHHKPSFFHKNKQTNKQIRQKERNEGRKKEKKKERERKVESGETKNIPNVLPVFL